MPGVRDQPGQHGETPSLLRIQKVSWTWGPVPIVPAQEAEEQEDKGRENHWLLLALVSLPCQALLGEDFLCLLLDNVINMTHFNCVPLFFLYDGRHFPCYKLFVSNVFKAV